MSAPTPSGTARDEDVLLDVVLTDPDLLQAEFEAIIAASWPDPPGPPRWPALPALMPHASGPRANQVHLQRPTNPDGVLPAREGPPAGRRERSPPNSPAPGTPAVPVTDQVAGTTARTPTRSLRP